MSTVYQCLCDQCGKIQEQKTGKERTPYDPDAWFGWIHLSGNIDDFSPDNKAELDLCSIICLRKWAQEQEQSQGWQT